MLDLMVALFVRFRVNGDVFDILKIGHAKPNIIIWANTLKLNGI